MERPNERGIDWTPDTARAHDVIEPLAAGDTAYTDYKTGWDLRRLRPLTTPGPMGVGTESRSTPVRVREPLLPYDRARLVPDGDGGYEARRW